MLHELKVYPRFFEETIEGNKTFEIRKNNRDFRVGDVLVLKEWDGTKYTKREVKVAVRYILNDEFAGLAAGYVAMGVQILAEEKMERSRGTGTALDRECKAMKKDLKAAGYNGSLGIRGVKQGGERMKKRARSLKNGALYTKDGCKLAGITNGAVEWDVQFGEPPEESVALVARSATGTFEGKLQVAHLDVLSLMYGMRITNNWLKMHGGLMTRRGGKRKKGRLF